VQPEAEGAARVSTCAKSGQHEGGTDSCLEGVHAWERASYCWPGVLRAVSMAFTKLDAGPNAAPEVCTTIEEVGSTGVGALTIVFIILMICGCVFIYKAVNCDAQKKCVRPHTLSGCSRCWLCFCCWRAASKSREPRCDGAG
jgi:hypothetical protein